MFISTYSFLKKPSQSTGHKATETEKPVVYRDDITYFFDDQYRNQEQPLSD